MVQTADVEGFVSVMFTEGLVSGEELTSILRKLAFQSRGLYTDLAQESVIACFEGLPAQERVIDLAISLRVINWSIPDQASWLSENCSGRD